MNEDTQPNHRQAADALRKHVEDAGIQARSRSLVAGVVNDQLAFTQSTYNGEPVTLLNIIRPDGQVTREHGAGTEVGLLPIAIMLTKEQAARLTKDVSVTAINAPALPPTIGDIVRQATAVLSGTGALGCGDPACPDCGTTSGATSEVATPSAASHRH